MIRYYDEEVEYLHSRIAKTKMELEKKFQLINGGFDTFKITDGNEIKDTKKLISDSSISD